MKAKKKPIEKLSESDLGVDLKPRIQTVKVTEPPKRQGGKKVSIRSFCQELRLSALHLTALGTGRIGGRASSQTKGGGVSITHRSWRLSRVYFFLGTASVSECNLVD
jgi:hypothetical protein